MLATRRTVRLTVRRVACVQGRDIVVEGVRRHRPLLGRYRPVAVAGVSETAGSRNEPKPGEQMDDAGRSRVRAGGESSARARAGGRRGCDAGGKGRRVV